MKYHNLKFNDDDDDNNNNNNKPQLTEKNNRDLTYFIKIIFA